MKRFVLVLAACGGSHPSPTAPAPPPAPDPVAHPDQPAPTAPRPEGPPVAAVRVVKTTYHGVTVEDPYQWLEADAPEVKAWSDAQNTFARATLDKLPDVAPIRAELDKILAAPITRYLALRAGGQRLFGLRRVPDKQQAELVVLADPAHPEQAKLVFDPIDAEHPRRSIDWFVPSPDGSKIAIAASDGGSEIADLRIVDLTGKQLEPAVPNVQRATAGGSAAWTPDGKGVYYTRYPAKGEKPDTELDGWQQLYFHQLGTPVAKDRYELGKDLPKNAEIMLDTDARARVIATVQFGDGGKFRHYLRDGRGWRQLDDWDDKIVTVEFGSGNDLWVISRKDAPRGKVMKLAANAKSSAEAVVVVPEDKTAIITDFYSAAGVLALGDRIYVRYQLGGPSELRVFSLAGKPQKNPPAPPVSSVSKASAWKGDVLFVLGSYTQPWTWQRYTPRTNALAELSGLSPRPPLDLSNIDVRREFATSKDGTQVPVNIAWPKNAPQDGSVPCVVTGYGGFGISSEPHVLDWVSPLLTRGICVAEANLRGGGEFGEDWHDAGRLLKKQNVFDDFNAALDFMVAKKYTSRAHLGIIGGSNGGLLMGAMIVQHPDAMKAVVANVGIYDMLRNELTSNGAFNTVEYGSVADEAQFSALYAYSPYHHVAKSITYPATLFYTGANDGRVAPWHSRKMVAALQAAQGGAAPILLRTSVNAGHGIGSNLSERLDTLATNLGFLIWQLH